eukprot:1459932-Prymnesium_polylepis.2
MRRNHWKKENRAAGRRRSLLPLRLSSAPPGPPTAAPPRLRRACAPHALDLRRAPGARGVSQSRRSTFIGAKAILGEE